MGVSVSIDVNPGMVVGGVVDGSQNIITSYHVQEVCSKVEFESGDFSSEIE